MLEVQNDRCSESSRMAHTWVWKLLHLIARSLLLTARLRHRLKHLQGEDAAVTVRTRFMFLVLFSRKIRQWTYCSLHTHTSPSNAKYVQKLHLPLLSAFGGRGTEELCVPGLLKPGITFPEHLEQKMKYRLKPEQTGQVSGSCRMAGGKPHWFYWPELSSLPDPHPLLFCKRCLGLPQPACDRQWVRLSSWAQVIRSVYGLLTAHGERQGPDSYGGEKTHMVTALVSCRLSELINFVFSFPFTGYLSLGLCSNMEKESIGIDRYGFPLQ